MKDLNLLKIFDTMMQTHSVSKTAVLLSRTPSAISQSLSKLRAEYGEVLFAKEDRSLTPTQFAYQLHETIKESLLVLNNSTNLSNTFDPLTSKRKFTIGSHALFDNLFILSLRKKIKERAPNVSFEVSSLVFDSQKEEDALRLRHVDAIIGLNSFNAASFNSKKLDKFDVKVICSKDHPRIKDSITLDQFLEEEHAVWVNTDTSRGHLHFRIDGERKVVYNSNSFFNVLNVVAESDIISLFSSKLIKQYNFTDNIKFLDPPFNFKELPLHLLWHKRLNRDKGFLWIKGLIEEVFEENKLA